MKNGSGMDEGKEEKYYLQCYNVFWILKSSYSFPNSCFLKTNIEKNSIPTLQRFFIKKYSKICEKMKSQQKSPLADQQTKGICFSSECLQLLHETDAHPTARE